MPVYIEDFHCNYKTGLDAMKKIISFMSLVPENY